MNPYTANTSNLLSCNHWPPMLAVIPTAHGFKVRCLTCGKTGPQRESTDLAWTALIRSPEEIGGREESARCLRVVRDDEPG